MREILRGGIDKMREAGVPVVGGHSINDDEINSTTTAGLGRRQKVTVTGT